MLQRFLRRLGHGGRGLTLLLADDRALRALNRRWRGRDAPTDVLSWAYADDPAQPLLGELAISLPRAQAQAAANGWDLRTEMLRLLAHGCAHLAGYDHCTRAQDRVMRRVEERLLSAVGVRGLYP